MNILVLDEEGTGLDFVLRCEEWGHDVRFWRPKACHIGLGLVHRVEDWKPWTDWAELIVLTGNSMYREEFQRLIDRGYPVFGPNDEGAKLETDRGAGQDVLKRAGIDTPKYETFSSLDKALAFVKKEKRGFAIKPWGGAADKAMTCVAKSAREAVYYLESWKAQRLKGEVMVQELIEGVEMGVSGWFGPAGWCEAIEEDWEEKKFMNDGLGCNTGEQGTVTRYVERSRLFDRVLKPLTDHFHSINYVGNVNVNCIIDGRGKPWPLEFTNRLGWPAFCLHQALQLGDPAQWMLDLLRGQDTLEMSSEVCVGVVLTHGNYPARTEPGKSEGRPIYGVGGRNRKAVHLQHVQIGVAPDQVGSEVRDVSMPVSAGDYLMVVTGTGSSVSEAAKHAYHVAWAIESPTNLQFRTDIGERLRTELDSLHEHGYAKDLEY